MNQNWVISAKAFLLLWGLQKLVEMKGGVMRSRRAHLSWFPASSVEEVVGCSVNEHKGAAT